MRPAREKNHPVEGQGEAWACRGCRGVERTTPFPVGPNWDMRSDSDIAYYMKDGNVGETCDIDTSK